MLSDRPEARPGDFARRCAAVRAPFAGVLSNEPGDSLVVQGPGVDTDRMLALVGGSAQVLGLPTEHGGSGFPSPWTALGVFAAIRGCVGEIANTRVAVQGAGFVGARLVELLTDAGAEVVVADLDSAKAAATGARTVPPSGILDVDCDVFSPNARDAALSTADVDRLRCRFVAGSANGQVADEAAARRLVERGIRHVPEEIAGSGWILNLAAELEPGGWSEAAATAKVTEIERLAC
jgi:leucine dehydrogenase